MKYKPADLSTIIFYSAVCLEKINQKQSLENIRQWLPDDVLNKKSNIIAYVKQSIRDYGISSYILVKHLINNKNHPKIEYILRISISLLINRDIKIHTLINQAVNACKMHKHTYYASGLVNAVLRKINESIDEYKNLDLTFLPKWWQELLQKNKEFNLEEYYKYIRNKSLMGLRVNAQKVDTDSYLDLLHTSNINAKAVNLYDKFSPYGILLPQQIDVEKLPNFSDGYVSVQDIAAQICPQILPIKNGMKVLDACSAPGGKILSCLEQYQLDITVMDINNIRLEKIKQNIKRLNIENQIINYKEYVGDASQLDWYDNQKFDIIITDVPCSASGIVRKQPEIALIRNYEDVINLQQIQTKIIQNLWHILKKSGILLYINCSVFVQEGLEQIKQFLSNNENASLINVDNIGQFQVCNTNDGFFYAVLQKNS